MTKTNSLSFSGAIPSCVPYILRTNLRLDGWSRDFPHTMPQLGLILPFLRCCPIFPATVVRRAFWTMAVQSSFLHAGTFAVFFLSLFLEELIRPRLAIKSPTPVANRMGWLSPLKVPTHHQAYGLLCPSPAPAFLLPFFFLLYAVLLF